ncbi:hypothetical protein RD792_009193 [Penstemon davidsonii]|uniref:Sm domain-containing protein n=1 Tax=Penstemon davidsonii TaxID=160366 RepID=A0ABR0DB80_9LAMI|nr:hypothetical protein RD792_009193 [Penstemon davidsonii]
MSGATDKASTTTKTPADFLKSIRGRPVVVKLNSGVDYRGILACLDGYMNIAMEQTEEYVNGQLKNKYGDAFIRGNNVRISGGNWAVILSPSPVRPNSLPAQFPPKNFAISNRAPPATPIHAPLPARIEMA